MIYADIIIDISSDKLDRSFQYRVPDRLEKEIKMGMVVSIPFGNSNQLRKGYVTGLSGEPKVEPSRLKEIAGCCSAEETDHSCCLDEKELWFDHDPGIEDSSSY